MIYLVADLECQRRGKITTAVRIHGLQLPEVDHDEFPPRHCSNGNSNLFLNVDNVVPGPPLKSLIYVHGQ